MINWQFLVSFNCSNGSFFMLTARFTFSVVAFMGMASMHWTCDEENGLIEDYCLWRSSKGGDRVAFYEGQSHSSADSQKLINFTNCRPSSMTQIENFSSHLQNITKKRRSSTTEIKLSILVNSIVFAIFFLKWNLIAIEFADACKKIERNWKNIFDGDFLLS